uniref:Hypothetical orf3 n=1 Tax=Epidermophyton floccosum TaxID=34391 RepID=Q3ZEH4_EPIFL|nr:hypothetical orf3 [Epidermophyton floccosum]AAW78229.1 hypothetical orf3 [Epidermophyton floccosum]
MNAGVNLIKSSALPVSVKVGTVVGAGAVGGLTTVAVNAINTLTQNKINTNNQNTSYSNQDASSSSGGPFTSGSSMIDDNNFNSVMELFYSNLGLQIIIIYLIFNLLILFLFKFVFYKWKFLYIKNIFGNNFYNYFLKIINNLHSINTIWILFITLILFITSIINFSITLYIFNNINYISEIVYCFNNK